MGADLYRSDFEHIHGNPILEQQFDELCKKRDELFEPFRHAKEGEEETPEFLAYKEAQEKVSDFYSSVYSHPRYFRDSYNCYSILNFVGMSWWASLQDYLGPEGDGVMEKVAETYLVEGREVTEEYDSYELHPVGMARLCRDLEARRPELEHNLWALKLKSNRNGIVKIDQFAAPEPYVDLESYFTSRFEQLLDFLKQAADGGYTIRCSV